MNFYDWLDALNLQLVIKRYAQQNERWTAGIDRAEIKEDSILIGFYGSGYSAETATENYMNGIKGKILIMNAMSAARQEIKVPVNLNLS